MKRNLLWIAAFATLLTPPAVAQNMEYSVVPAMSSVKHLPDTEPTDGIKSGTVGIIAAKGEFESASFLLKSDRAVKKAVLTPTDLKNAKGDTIPASALDLKVLKVWYQAGTGWHSYFADVTGRTQVPELLLNDETLIKVDHATKDNYLRVINADGKAEYVWISNYAEIDVPLNLWQDTVADAATFQPISLDAGLWKQIWVTLEAPKAAEGLYKGTIDVAIDGKTVQKIPVSVRVLPFELPTPMTNYDLTKEFYCGILTSDQLNRYLQQSKMDWARSEARLRASYRNMKRHNLVHPNLPTARNLGFRHSTELADRVFRRNLEIYKECGMDTKTLFDAVRGIPDYAYLKHKDRDLPLAEQKLPDYWERDILAGKKMVEEVLGKGVTVYCFGWDEPGMRTLRAQRLPWKFLHDNGLKVISSAHSGHLLHGGFNEDFVDLGGTYEKAEAAKWHAIGTRVTTYAAPHTGPENPDIVRRNHGLDLYLSDYDGTYNYILNNRWNDFTGAAYNFRSFSWVYDGSLEPINTIQFVGYREAIDDVKYATLLQQLARKAIATGKTENVYAGRIALQYLALIDGKKADLNTVRLEMINHILHLRKLVK